jgi:hypothetical protein
MNKNVASWDRIIRAVLGIILLYVGIAGLVSGSLGILLAIIGGVFLVTGLIGFCPIYALFKLSTKKA